MPQLAEQRAIAAALSDVDGLHRALKALIAKKHAIKQAAMQQLLTGRIRLPVLTKDVPNTGYNRHFKLLQDLTFTVPSQSEQTAIAAVLSDMDAEVAVLERRLDKVREIKQGMMQQLLTGRVRLVERETLAKQTAAA